MGSATKKVEGGKLLRVDVEAKDSLDSVKITGDFFLHPEDTIEEMEEALLGEPVPLEKRKLVDKLNHILDKNEAKLIGISTEHIIDTLEEAL
ncbi:MAG: lipoate protein ligase C-terminal domain-containing protein [Nanoarchaeota archaeon]